MAKVKDLPPEIRNPLIREFKFRRNDEISYFSTSGLDVEGMIDEEDDSKFHFHISGKNRQGFILVEKDKMHFISEKVFTEDASSKPISFLANGTSHWTDQIDPSNGNPAQWPDSVIKATEKEERDAKKLLKRLTGTNPKKDMKLLKSAVYTLISELPPEHPAREFILNEMSRLHKEMLRARRLSSSEKKADVEVKIAERAKLLLESMKSAGTYYAAAERIWNSFDSIRQKETVRILVPGAGINTVAVMAMAKRLIDLGAPGVEILATEIERAKGDMAMDLIGEWAENNPKIFTDRLRIQHNPRYPSHTWTGKGLRDEYHLYYNEHLIQTIYAINDSPGDLYFNPQDLSTQVSPGGKKVDNPVDIVIVHDSFSSFADPDIAMLAQLLPNLPEGHQVALLTTNGLEVNLDAYTPHTPSVFPFLTKDSYICGPYGCASYYSLGAFPEGGPTRNSSALLFPVSKMTQQEVNMLVSFSIMAGGRSVLVEENPNSIYGGNRRSEVVEKNIPVNDPVKIFEWASGKFKELDSARKKDYFCLVAARLVVKYINDSVKKPTPEQQRKVFLTAIEKLPIMKALKEAHLIDPDVSQEALFQEISDSTKAKAFIDGLDKILLKMQKGV